MIEKMDDSILKDLNEAAQAIYDKKGFNILVLDVRGICTMTDFFIIAEGSVDRHVKALAQTIIDSFSKKGQHPLFVEGLQEGDWVVLDYSSIIFHLFTPELRERYAIEELWKTGKIVEVKIDTSQPVIKK